MKLHEYNKIENKLELRFRDAGDRLSWFVHDGVTVVRTKRSHGNKELPGHLIRQQLKLNEEQFSGLIDCSLTKQDYIGILTDKGLIPKAKDKPTDKPEGLKQPPAKRA